MGFSRYLTGATIIIAVTNAFAQAPLAGATYRCVDDAGRSTYTNVREEMAGKKCAVVSREVSVVPAPPVAAPAAGPRPAAKQGSDSATRVDAPTQRSRDSDRRRILDQELQNADKQLADARRKLAEQEAIRSGDERNYQRVLDRLKPFQDDVRIAEDNVAALKREISNIR